jgi:hypothetical protein
VDTLKSSEARVIPLLMPGYPSFKMPKWFPVRRARVWLCTGTTIEKSPAKAPRKCICLHPSRPAPSHPRTDVFPGGFFL